MLCLSSHPPNEARPEMPEEHAPAEAAYVTTGGIVLMLLCLSCVEHLLDQGMAEEDLVLLRSRRVPAVTT